MPGERPSPPPAVPVEVLRRAVRERVDATSIRVVAEETGMSPTGLWRFLAQNTAPYTKTQRRLQQWYVVQQSAAPVTDDELPADVARAAIALLTRHLPERRRSRHVRQLLDAVSDPGGREPAWLAALRDQTF